MTKLLLLGYTGKMGIALNEILKEDYEIIGKNSQDFDAFDFEQVKEIVKEVKPGILINTVAMLGIDPCEKEPEKAIKLNSLYPKLLAELSNEMDFLLVHFSTDAVFNNKKEGTYTESNTSQPLNTYGLTKYGADCFIQAIAKKYYIFRISLLFGETSRNNQFVEKMLQKIKESQSLRIADDIIVSPSYSKDIAKKAKQIIEQSSPYGLYHITNEGPGTLYEVIDEIVNNLKLNINVEKGSYKDFPFVGIKNIRTPLSSEKIKFLRPWKEAIKEYCNNLKV